MSSDTQKNISLFKIIGLGVVTGLLLSFPLAVIWGCNTLFGASWEYDWKHWLALVTLNVYFYGMVSNAIREGTKTLAQAVRISSILK